MTDSTPSIRASELRSRIAQLRQEITVTTDDYYAARKNGRGGEVMGLLRKRASLIRELFQAQSELLLALRSVPDEGR
jgi:hypothetical protein